MSGGFRHKVLIVDEDHKNVKDVRDLLDKKGIKTVSAENGPAALKRIREADKKPFSVIIADQRMEEMPGTQLLEHAKRLCPDTLRFLLTAYSDIETIMTAVNKGSIHQYIQKPWDPEQILAAVKKGFRQFEVSHENDNLLSLAKEQNAKLYDLNCELMETTKGLNNELVSIEKDIEAVQKQISRMTSKDALSLPDVISFIEKALNQIPDGESNQSELLLHETIRVLHEQLSEIANRSGFELETPRGVIE